MKDTGDRPAGEKPVRRTRPPRVDAEGAPGAAVRPRALDPRALQRLQGRAGNAAVTRLVAPRSAAPSAAQVQRLDSGSGSLPAPPTGLTPGTDPRFKKAAGDIRAKKDALAKHPTAASQAKAAQDAAKAPGDDKEAQAKAAQAGEMGAAKPGSFDKAAFIAAVEAAIAAKAPKTLDEADKFASSGKVDEVKGQVSGQVKAGKESSAKDIAEKTAAAPDPSRAVEKPVTPLPGQPAPVTPAAPDPRALSVAPAPAAQTDLRTGPRETDAMMAEAKLTPEQLAHSNEPKFTEALDAKKESDAHAATAPGQFRAAEAARIATEQGGAAAAGPAAMQAMTAARTGAGQQVAAGQATAQGKDEAKRAAVTAELKSVFEATKGDVERTLGALDGEVETAFETGQKAAHDAFTSDHQARMKRYKDQRYAGVSGAAQWLVDLVLDLPPEANQIFQESKKTYEAQMRKVVSDIADLIGRRLGEATARIATGKARIAEIVASQPRELQQFAQQAGQDIGAEFSSLESSVSEKSQGLVQDLADKYVAARDELDKEIEGLQAENKGLLSKAKDAIKETAETVMKLKDMLLGVLARAAGAIDKIITKPIEFLGNLVNAVKAGVMGFAARIGDHLKNGLKQWLFGQLSAGGIEIPETFDAKGIMKMILSILGLTWSNIRTRVVARIGEPAMKGLETGFEMVQVLVTEGIGGLWKWISGKLSDLKDTVIGAVKDFVIEKIVTAGITWIVSMLNPASAFVRACKAIYDVVMFFVNRASQIKSFVDSVLDSVESIANGGSGAVAGLIENSLAKAVPVVLDFLAGLLGLGGISEKIKSILAKIQAPVMKAVDWVIDKIVNAGKKILSSLKGGESGESAKVKALARTKLAEAWPSIRSEEGLKRAVATIEGDLRPQGLKKFDVVKEGDDGYGIFAEASPRTRAAGVKLSLSDTATVTVDARVVFAAPPKIEEKFGSQALRKDGRVVMEDGRPVMVPHSLPAAIEGHGGKTARGTQIGGQIQPMQPGETVARVETWNTRDPVKGSHASHAEYQFAQWLAKTVDRGSKVTEVSLKVIGRGPCPGCTGTLNQLLARLGGGRTVAAAIDYDAKEHKDWQGTGTTAQEKLTGAGWTVNGERVPAELKA
ncbi:phage tail protein [Streptomyces sp. NPDC054956]